MHPRTRRACTPLSGRLSAVIPKHPSCSVHMTHPLPSSWSPAHHRPPPPGTALVTQPLASSPGCRTVPLHACPPLGQDGQARSPGDPAMVPTLPQLPSHLLSTSQDCASPRDELFASTSAVPTKPVPILPPKQTQPLQPTAPRSPSVGLAWPPSCPAPLGSRPHLPESGALHCPPSPLSPHHPRSAPRARGCLPWSRSACHHPQAVPPPALRNPHEVSHLSFSQPPSPTRAQAPASSPLSCFSPGLLRPNLLSPFCHQPMDLPAQLSACPKVSRHPGQGPPVPPAKP